MTTKIFRNPTFKTKISSGVFINQDLIVFPQGRMPNNLREVIKFLFGEGVIVKQDRISDHGCLRITGASYVLDNVETLNADWICEEVEE